MALRNEDPIKDLTVASNKVTSSIDDRHLDLYVHLPFSASSSVQFSIGIVDFF